MALSVKHLKVSDKADGQDPSLLQPSDWNASHVLKVPAQSLIGNSNSSEGNAESINISEDFVLKDDKLSLVFKLSDVPLLVYATDPDNPSKARILTESATIDLAGSTTAITASVKGDSIALGHLQHSTAGGEILYYSKTSTPIGAPTRLPSGTLGTVLLSNGLTTNPSWEYVGPPHCVLVEQEDNGVNSHNGGIFAKDGWRDRAINTQIIDTFHAITFAGNIFTLGIGTWYIEWSCPARMCNNHQTRLYNNTASAHPVVYGTSEYAGETGNAQTRSTGIAQVINTVATGYKIQHYCKDDGTFGAATGTGSGAKEVYTIVKIWRTGA